MFDFKFDWSAEMELGIPILDEQHKEIFRIARNIEQLLIQNCENVKPRDLVNIVCELREFVSYHFYEEERMMEKAGFDRIIIKEHKKNHMYFYTYVQQIDLPKMAKDPNGELKILRDNIQDWIFSHMLCEDVTIVKTLKENLTEEELKNGITN